MISIQDNGRGIDSEILSKLGKKGASFGKDGIQNGFGLGIYHARSLVEGAGGRLEIESKLGQGTVVTLWLPKVSTPWWFIERIDLKPNQLVVSLDDDHSIHQIWESRLKSKLKSLVSNIRHLSFSSAPKMIEWCSKESIDKVLFLIDYELLNSKTNGLETIEMLGIASQSILVTSRFDEILIQDKAKQLGIKIIPKGLSPFVPIEIYNSAESMVKVFRHLQDAII